MDLDKAELKIVKELIRNPRLSDNQVAKKTKVPVMSVNRKRKKLEEEGFLSYFTYLNVGEEGIKHFHARQLYILKFRIGLTSKVFLDSFKKRSFNYYNSKYIVESYLGEQQGHLALIIMLEAETEADLLEIFNGKIVAALKKSLGDNVIADITTMRVTIPIRLFHNYLPLFNMKKGKIQESWRDDLIFVD